MLGRIVAALTLALWVATPVHAQDPDPSDPMAATPATLHGALRLSLEDAISMGLKNNLDVEVSRYEPLASWEEFRSAWGTYDPNLFAEFGYESSETPVANSLQASFALIEREVGGQGGIRGKIPWLNATYGLAYDGSSVETTSSISDLSPEYRASISAEASVPLLKNLIWDRDWTRVKQSEKLYDISAEQFRQQVMDTVQSLENAYWNLVASEDAVRVAEKGLEAAEALLRQTKTQYEVGVVSRVEVTEAEAGLAERDVNLIRTRNLYLRNQDVLMNEVLGRGLRPGSRMAIEPSTRPDDYIVYQIDLEEATHKAFENRPELAGAYDEIERRKIEVSYRKNQKLPQLDLKLRYWLQGLSGKTNPAPNVFGQPRGTLPAPPNYRNAHDDYFTGDRADSWSAMGVLSYPIGNRAARHQANKAEIELRKAASQVARLRQNIILEVRNATRDLEAAQEGIEAAERQRIATEEQLRAERIRLEQGESTPFDVLLRERDLVDAEVSKIDALRIYRNSVVDLDRSQGTILRTRNILIDDVRQLR